MEIILKKEWKREGKKTIKKGRKLYVTDELGKALIKKKIARSVREFYIPILTKKVVPDGTKQTAKKVKPKKEQENGDNREI